ncbi:MAG TPA: hypothetical protein VF844_19520 [Ktedonobacteraceae bacterium]
MSQVASTGGHLPAKWVDGILHRLPPRGASTGAAPPQPLSQALPADPGAGELLAEAARTDGLSDPTCSRAGRSGLAAWKAATNW